MPPPKKGASKKLTRLPPPTVPVEVKLAVAPFQDLFDPAFFPKVTCALMPKQTYVLYVHYSQPGNELAVADAADHCIQECVAGQCLLAFSLSGFTSSSFS